jgi:hypothetical protein|tara:strand:- start:16764 stop:17084 length:321 start_codon:yes stop_codon:yes gene_type:complete
LLYPAELWGQLPNFFTSLQHLSCSVSAAAEAMGPKWFKTILNKKGEDFSSPVSGWQDSNLRPPRPKRGAIPGYATPRTLKVRFAGFFVHLFNQMNRLSECKDTVLI